MFRLAAWRKTMSTDEAIVKDQQGNMAVGTTSVEEGAKRAATAESATAPSRKSHSTAKKKMSPQQEQYYRAIAMTSAELGAAIKSPTERIAQHVGNALAHDVEAKKERDEAQREFQENIAYYYEAKQRLLNPGYRTDVDGGKDRTPEDNVQNFGAPTWAAFAEICVAYSLKQADRKLRAFAKANGLLTDEGSNIDDVEPGEDSGAERPQPRRTEDPTVQKRYEFIATAAMDIASRNPEGEVEKQILAAAEHEPAPLMPVPPDLFAEVLGFITEISSSATDARVRAQAKALVNKLRLHQPLPPTSSVPPEVAREEKRKRDKRLAKKNGGPLGSMALSPAADATPGHVQRLKPTPTDGDDGSGSGARPAQDAEAGFASSPGEPGSGPGAESQSPDSAGGGRLKAAGAACHKVAETKGTAGARSGEASEKRRLQKREASRRHREKKKALRADRAVAPVAPQSSGAGTESHLPGRKSPGVSPIERRPVPGKPLAPVKVMVCPPVLSPEEEERGAWGAFDHPAIKAQGFVRNGEGRYEYEPEARDVHKNPGAQPGQLPPRMATAAKPCRVKKRVKGDIVHFLVIREGDSLPEEVFNTKAEAEEFCERLNAPRVAGIVPPVTDPRSAAQSAAY